MKNFLLIILLVAAGLTVNAQGRWNVGLQLSATGNHSKYVSGNEQANALFSNNPFGAGLFGVYFRYRLANHWSMQTGLDFSEFGYEYAISKDYSLLKPFDHYTTLRTGTCMSRIPVMAIYNSKLNCSNTRFVAGAGFTFSAIDNNWTSETSTTVSSEEGNNIEETLMTEQTNSKTGASGSFTFMIGIEKVLKKGNMFAMTFQANHGFKPISTSTVNYTISDKDYTHTFENYGSFGSFSLCYYFQPIGTRKLNKVKPN